MNILVTGGSGFVGKEMITLLLSHGHHVTNIDLKESHIDDITEIIHDLTHSYSSVHGSNVCIHLASAVGGIVFNCETFDLIEYNDRINANVLSMCQQSGSRLIFVSSVNVLENAEVCDDIPPMPSSKYAQSKIKGEDLFVNNLPDCVVVRPTNLFGKSQISSFYSYGTSHVIPDLLHKIREASHCINVWGDGCQMRNFLHVYDFCEFIMSLISAESVETFNAVGSSITVSISELAACLMDFDNMELKINYDNQYMQYESMHVENFLSCIKDVSTIQSIQEGLLI